MSDEVQVEASDEGKLIGSNESEFEAVLLDGCLGFGFSVGNAVFSLAMVLVGIQAAAEKGIVASYAAAVVALMLFLGMRTTDTLQTKRGRGFTLALYVTAFAGVAVCAVLGGGLLHLNTLCCVRLCLDDYALRSVSCRLGKSGADAGH